MDEDHELERLRMKKLREMMEIKESESDKTMLDRPVIITDGNFEEELANDSLLVVDFWAPWCGPCHVIAPMIESLAKKYTGKAIFGKLNVDENPITSTKFGVMSIPTLLIFKDGRVVDSVIGALPMAVLEERIRKHIVN